MARARKQLPKPSKLYAQHPITGARRFIGDAYTLDAATEAIDDDWPRDCLPVLVEPDGTELQFDTFEDGRPPEWVKRIPIPLPKPTREPHAWVPGPIVRGRARCGACGLTPRAAVHRVADESTDLHDDSPDPMRVIAAAVRRIQRLLPRDERGDIGGMLGTTVGYQIEELLGTIYEQIPTAILGDSDG